MKRHIDNRPLLLTVTAALLASATATYCEDSGGGSPNGLRSTTTPREVPANADRRSATDESGRPVITAVTNDGQEIVCKSLDDIATPGDVLDIEVRDGEFGDSDAAALARFSELRYLYLPGFADGRPTELTDAGLKAVACVGTLKVLGFGSDRISDSGVAQLCRLTGLTSLLLRGARVTDAGLGSLARLPSLSDLSLRAPRVTDAGLAALAGCGTLTQLDVCGTEVTGTGFRIFPSQSALSKVEGNFTDDGLAAISELRWSITSINVFGNQATDAGLAHLDKLPSLTRVGLFETRVTDAAVDKFIEGRGRKVRVDRHIQQVIAELMEDALQVGRDIETIEKSTGAQRN